MKHKLALLLAALPVALSAIDLSQFGDIAFAEAYAFSTNRAAVIATLQPETPQWYTYSILNAQTEGRLADAAALIRKWPALATDERGFQTRQRLLAFDEAKPDIGSLRTALANCGIGVSPHYRETPLAPNTYSSVLDPAQISFAAFWERNRGLALEPGFSFLPLLGDPAAKPGDAWQFNPSDATLLPDTPGLMAAIVRYLTDARARGSFRTQAVFSSLTLAQLDELARRLKDTKHDLYANADFARLVLSKLRPGADDALALDPTAERALLLRRTAFADQLAPALRSLRLETYRELLAFGSRCGEEAAFKEAFKTYLGLLAGEQRHLTDRDGRLTGGDHVTAYLSVYCRAGSDLSEFSGLIAKNVLETVIAETELLAGRTAPTRLPDAQFAALRDRVELTWNKTNPTVFGATDDVKLTLEVKNVKRLRLSIYELDSYEACRTLGGEVKADIDLDGAVPTLSRAVDFSRYPALVRHTETLLLPELKQPGLYVVECAGNGLCSRAVVRKGALRAVERRDAAGHIFVVLDEQGHVVKGARLRLGETVFTADDTGEIAVPFAPDEKSAGRKIAVIGAGRLATTVAFTHTTERLELTMAAVIPPETLVAGRRATALVRPRLRVSGTPASLTLLQNPKLTMTFTDLDGHVSVRPYPALALADDLEGVVTFTVPERLAEVRFDLTGTVRRAVDGRDEPLAATATTTVNGLCAGRTIEQAFLRRTAKGYRLELRGRNGEPLAARAFELHFKHRLFTATISQTLQTDDEGAFELGALADIERLSLPDLDRSWDLSDAWRVLMPLVVTAAEGETIELPARKLLAGTWPGAKRLPVRVSLLERNAEDQVTADRIAACSFTDGVLRLAGLPAGDYTLTLRDRCQTCRISVAKTAEGRSEGGILASAARALTDLGEPSLLRVAGADCDTNGVLTVRLANATPETRVHLFAARTRTDEGEGPTPGQTLAAALTVPTAHVTAWGACTSDYVSGRPLGEKLQYVLERRDQPPRVGNMLDRPSLLLNPWSVSETETQDLALGAGRDWDRAAERTSSVSGDLRSSRHGGWLANRKPSGCGPCRDFLPEAELVIANLRPDAEGRIAFDLSAAPEVGLCAQDFLVVATDGRALDTLELTSGLVPFAPRDRRHRADARATDAVRTKTYETAADLFPLLRALGLPKPDQGDFSFVAQWTDTTETEKRALYDRYASHELDFFLFERDPAFFETVVRPHLANKRLKRFVDRWLLGEDVSAYATPGELANLNAFEQCLLARRVPAVAPQIARRFADWCAAHPLAPERVDAAYDTVFATTDVLPTNELALSPPRRADANAIQAIGCVSPCSALAEDDEDEALEDEALCEMSPAAPKLVRSANWSSQAALLKASAAPRLERARRSPLEDRAVTEKRRAARALYRPPERTREWVETHYYRVRQNESARDLVGINPFWRDYAAAIAAGRTDDFASENLMFATASEREGVLALAVVKAPVTFVRTLPPQDGTLVVSRRFHDPRAMRANGRPGAEVKDELVKGLVYDLVTVVTNPTDDERRETVRVEIPQGAIALDGARAVEEVTVRCLPYRVQAIPRAFYFPEVTDGVALGSADGKVLPVVTQPTKVDTTSWDYVSQQATKGEVLAYLKEKNLELEAVDLGKIAWRMKDGTYARQVLAVLAGRGVYHQELWLAGLVWREAFDADRIREALAREENRRAIARKVGTALVSPLVTIEPERDNLFEQKEYWPLINARAHAIAGAARLANQQLAAEYRAFLDVLATRPALSDDDRLLATIYLIAQDRLSEAKEQLAQVVDTPATRMQLAYLKAYLAFCDGAVDEGRAWAAPYVDHPVEHWRKRFREVIAQADEIAGHAPAAADAEAARAPTLALATRSSAVVITSRNLASCTLKAYPTDLEVSFSKDPFGVAAKGKETVRCLKPAWSAEVALAGDGETTVTLPASVAARNLVLVATGEDGRAEAMLEAMPRTLDVQVTREYRQLRVRDTAGRPLPGTYVKVYAKDVAGREMKFLKDGYTDLRGAFDYASVSTDTDFKPAEYAILVLHDKEGVKTLRVAE